MARKPELTFYEASSGKRYDTLGGMFGAGLSRMIGRMRYGSSRTVEQMMRLTGDVWIDVVQSTAIKAPPAHRDTIVVDMDVGARHVRLGWENFPGGDADARFEWRWELFKPIFYDMVREFSLGVDSKRQFRKVANRARQAMRVATSVGRSQSDYEKSARGHGKVRMGPRSGRRRMGRKSGWKAPTRRR